MSSGEFCFIIPQNVETKLCKILFSFLRTESVQAYILGSIPGFPS